MKKRIISLIVTLCLLFSFVPMAIFAEDIGETNLASNESVTPIAGDWSYEACDGGVTLTEYNGNSGDVYVPAKLTVNSK